MVRVGWDGQDEGGSRRVGEDLPGDGEVGAGPVGQRAEAGGGDALDDGVLDDAADDRADDEGRDRAHIEPGGVEAHLQELLAQHPEALGEGFTLVRREYPTPIGPVDILTRDANGKTVAVEVKRRGGIDGVEQLTRYVELLNRDEILAPVKGLFAAQEIKPQARTLAEDRGFTCVTVDYDELRGTPSQELRLF